MKKEKLKINKLKVQSFVTSVELAETKTVKGGLLSIGDNCTLPDNGCNTTGGRCQTDGLFCRRRKFIFR